jgi:hypothetical protein
LTTAAEEIVAAKLEAKERILFAKRGAERAVESVLEEAAAAAQRVRELEAKQRILFAKREAERAVESVLEEAAAAKQRVRELEAQLKKASPSRHQLARVVDSHLNPHDGSETWTERLPQTCLWPLLGSSADQHSSSILPSPPPPITPKPHPSQRQRQHQQGKRILGQPATLEDVRNGIAYDESRVFPLNTILIVQRSDCIW